MKMVIIPHICHFFSTGTIFGSIFLHAKARKSYKKFANKDFATKHCEMQQNTINCTHYFSTFQIFLTFIICGEFFPHDNLSYEEFLHLTICYMDKFLHMTIFSPRAPPVVPVTKTRYDWTSTTALTM